MREALVQLGSGDLIHVPSSLRTLRRLAFLDEPPPGIDAALGETYLRLDMHREGLACFDELRLLRPHDSEALAWAARFRQSFPALHTEALELYERLLRAAPEAPSSYERYASFLHDRQLYQREIDLLQAGLLRHPHHAAMRNQLGLALQRQGRYQEAETVFRELLEDAPDHEFAALNLGYLMFRRNQLGLAAAWFRRVLESDPHNSEALYNLARIAIMRGDVDRAQVIAHSLESLTRAD
jgi:tetratricopeptide (TPR) repeat protein